MNNLPSKNAHGEFIESWKGIYKAKTGEEYLTAKKDYVIIANLLKKFSLAKLIEKTALLFELCQTGKVYFARSMADFTIGNLSVNWNKLIKEVKNDTRTAGISNSELECFLSGRS